MSKRNPMSLTRKLSWVLATALVGVGANAVGLAWSVNDASNARQENCRRVSEAFDVFTDRLIQAFEAEGTPEAEAFRSDIHDALDDCS